MSVKRLAWPAATLAVAAAVLLSLAVGTLGLLPTSSPGSSPPTPTPPTPGSANTPPCTRPASP
ncbi:hypothetical protein AB0I50_49395, partial [Streptomyces prunicolor]